VRDTQKSNTAKKFDVQTMERIFFRFPSNVPIEGASRFTTLEQPWRRVGDFGHLVSRQVISPKVTSDFGNAR
jgi:hypothetical protein